MYFKAREHTFATLVLQSREPGRRLDQQKWPGSSSDGKRETEKERKEGVGESLSECRRGVEASAGRFLADPRSGKMNKIGRISASDWEKSFSKI